MEQRNIFLSVELCGPLYEKFIDYLDKSLGEELIGYYRQNVFKISHWDGLLGVGKGSLSLRRMPDEKPLQKRLEQGSDVESIW